MDWLSDPGFVTTLVGAVAGALALVGLGAFMGRFLYPRVIDEELQLRAHRAESEAHELSRRLERQERLVDALKHERDLWSLREPERPPGYEEWAAQGIPRVLLVANLKGGVGKTTLSANLAAYFDQRRGLRTLLVDLDYQASLSSMLARAAHQTNIDGQVAKVLMGEWDGEHASLGAHDLRPSLSRARFLMSDYRLAQVENRLMIEWAFGDTDRDTRFNLARAIIHPAMRDRFDLVIIDAPPRLTFGMISALAASTHILAPTVIDNMSAETVGNFLAAVRGLRGDLNPNIQLAGIVRTLAPNLKLGGPQQDAMPRLQDALDIWGEGGVIFDAHIPRRQAIAGAAGAEIAYTLPGKEGEEVRALFDPLGEEVAVAMGWPPTQTAAPRVPEEDDEPPAVEPAVEVRAPAVAEPEPEPDEPEPQPPAPPEPEPIEAAPEPELDPEPEPEPAPRRLPSPLPLPPPERKKE